MLNMAVLWDVIPCSAWKLTNVYSINYDLLPKYLLDVSINWSQILDCHCYKLCVLNRDRNATKHTSAYRGGAEYRH
jgi:hypothetical protein